LFYVGGSTGMRGVKSTAVDGFWWDLPAEGFEPQAHD
jgi:hypothetical protein